MIWFCVSVSPHVYMNLNLCVFVSTRWCCYRRGAVWLSCPSSPPQSLTPGADSLAASQSPACRCEGDPKHGRSHELPPNGKRLKLKLEWMSWKLTPDHSVKTVCLLWEGWSHCQRWDQWSVRRHQSVYHPGTKRGQTLDRCHQTSDCNPDAFLWGNIFIQMYTIQENVLKVLKVM